MISFRLHSVIILVLFVFFFSSGVVAENPLAEELEMLTGTDARACGFIPLGENPEEAWPCVDDAEEKGGAYWIAIEREGVDSDIWIAGLRASSGRRYVLEYDSNYMGRPGLIPSFWRKECLGKLVLTMNRGHGRLIQCSYRGIGR